MNSTKRLFYVSAVFLVSCIQLPGVERPTSLTLTLTAPADTTYTNGAVSIQLQVQGVQPEHVELLLDDEPLTALETPYRFEWDTASTPEGAHQLRARAQFDGQEFRSEAREVVVDRTPPRVAEQKPTPGAQDVWVREPIEAIFSEPIRARTLTQDSVKLKVGETETATTLSLSPDGKNLTITPVTRPTVPNSLQLSLSAAVTDLAGNPLTPLTGTWTWNLPISFPAGTLSIPGDTNPYTPHILITKENKPFVSWAERTQAPRYPFTIHTYHLADSGWLSTASPLTAHITYENLSWHPHASRLDSSNNPTIIWPQVDDSSPIGKHYLKIKHWNSINWEDLSDTSTASSNLFEIEDNAGFAIHLDGRDTPTIAWSSASSNLRVWHRTNNTWLELSSALNNQQIIRPDHIQLRLDNTGKACIAWTEGDIFVRRWNGSAWDNQGSPIGNLPGDTPAHPESMVLDELNRPILAWTEVDIAAPSIQLIVSRLEGSTWQPLGAPLDTASGDNTVISSVSIQTDNSGNLFIAWMKMEDPQYPLHFKLKLRRWTGDDWAELGAPITVFAYRYNPYETRTMSFVVDQLGRPYVAWPGMLLGAPGEPGVQIHRYNY